MSFLHISVSQIKLNVAFPYIAFLGVVLTMLIFALEFFLFPFAAMTASGMIDPCQMLCEEFSATRRGNGLDLCGENGETSACFDSPTSDFCSNLYWDTNENGQRGLVFETNESPQEHHLNQVTCLEAATNVNINYNPLIHVGFAIVLYLQPPRYRVATIEFNLFSSWYRREITRGGPLKYLTAHMLQQFADVNLSTMVDVLTDLAGGYGINTVPETSHDVRCTRCRLWMFEDERIVLQTNGTSSFLDLLSQELRTPMFGEAVCPHCQHSNNVTGVERLRNLGRVVTIQVDGRTGANITIPSQFDLSSSTYSLVAQTHTGAIAQADIRIGERWFQVNATHSQLLGYNQSSSDDYDWFIYTRND